MVQRLGGDLYLKGVLTVIAACLAVLAFRAGGPAANAQGGFVCGGSRANPCHVTVVDPVDIDGAVEVFGAVQVYGTVEVDDTDGLEVNIREDRTR